MTSIFYGECNSCNGEGGHSIYCCTGIDKHDGSISCGCYGRGSWEDCDECDGSGKVVEDQIQWDFNTLHLEDTHDHSKYYSLIGNGKNRQYIATAIYSDGIFQEIIDIEIK